MSATTASAPTGVAGLTAEQTCPYVVVRDPDAVRDVLHRPDDFIPSNALIAATPLSGASLRVLQRARFALPPVLASNCTDTHAGIRRVVAAFFTPAKVAAIEPRIRELARDSARLGGGLLDGEGSVDLVQAVAAFPPAQIMLELLGLPSRDLPALKTWSLDSLELFWGWPDEERQLELAHSAAAFYGWLRELVLESVSSAEHNLFRSLAGHGLSTPEICSLGYFLLIAGQETTTQLISTTLFRVLEVSAADAAAATSPVATSPVNWRQAADSASARAAVRHILATESSVPTWRRVAAKDSVVDGEHIPAGAEILLELTGNHGGGDGFSDDGGKPGMDSVGPDSSRTRSTAYGLAFGSGIHRCLGAKLAELEAAVVLQETAAALPGLVLADPSPEWLRLLSFQAPRTVTVARDPGSGAC